MSTSDAPKLLLLLKPRSPLSDKHSCHKNSSSVYILRLFNPSFSTALNLRFTLLISPQLAKIDSLHYKALHKIFQVKSPYILQVSPCIAALRFPCSIAFLFSLSYLNSSQFCIPSSMRISDSRIKYLGHILRHPNCPNFVTCFNHYLSFLACHFSLVPSWRPTSALA